MLEMLQDNALFVVGILCLALSAVLLLACVSVCKRINKRNRHIRVSGRSAHGRSIGALENEPFTVLMIIDPKKRAAESVIGPIDKISGISSKDVLKDAFSLGCCFDSDERRHVMEEFDKWDMRSLLQIETDMRNDATGEVSHISLSAFPDDSGKWLVELRDITDEHTRMKNLERAAFEAEASEKAKLRFLSDMSHEIRTPMNGIMGTLALAQIHVEEPDSVRDYLQQADDLTQYLLSIINNVLDISKIENGKMVLEKRCFSLNDVMDRMHGLFKESTKTKGINYVVEGGDLDSPYIVGDELRLVQVITNLVSNAQKFTPAGGEIRVSLLHVQSTDDMMHFMIRVSDTGKGMDKKFLKTIFDPFSQESSSTSRQFGGTGLGMAISDQIIRLMGGYIIVESKLGEGSSFEIYLGLPIANDEQIAGYIAETSSEIDSQVADAAAGLFSIKGSKILMAEDNMLNAGIAEEMLLEMGAEFVDHAADGKIACDMFASSEQGHYNIVLMDIQMPNMDGREAARTIRSMGHPDSLDIPIIALSADAYVEDKRASREAGMNGHISKPIVYETLEQQICAELINSGAKEQ